MSFGNFENAGSIDTDPVLQEFGEGRVNPNADTESRRGTENSEGDGRPYEDLFRGLDGLPELEGEITIDESEFEATTGIRLPRSAGE